MVSTQVLAGPDAIGSIAPEWSALVGDTFTSAFSRPEWYQAWIDAFEPKHTALITARDGGELAGVLPLGRIRTDARGLYMAILAPFARGDYQPPVIAPGREAEILPVLLEAAFRHFGRRGVLWWPNIPETDASLPVLESFLRSRNMPYVQEREGAPRLRFNGADFAAVEQGWSSSHRKDVRRQRKRLGEQGPVTLWTPSSPEEAVPVLNEFFQVHDEKWLSQGFPGMFQHPGNRRHFHAIMKRMFGKGAHFSTLRCGEQHISYHFGFVADKWLQWYRPSFRTEFSGYSPSKIHIAMLIEEACRQNWNGFDFLLGAESYKDVWANESHEVVSTHAGFHSWSPSYVWFTRGKPYFRQRFQVTYMRARAWMQKLRKPPAA